MLGNLTWRYTAACAAWTASSRQVVGMTEAMTQRASGVLVQVVVDRQQLAWISHFVTKA